MKQTLILIAIFVVFLSVVRPASAIRLEYNLKKGSEARYKIDMPGTIKMTNTGSPSITVILHVNGVYIIKGTGITPEGTRLAKLEQVSGTFTQGLGEKGTLKSKTKLPAGKEVDLKISQDGQVVVSPPADESKRANQIEGIFVLGSTSQKLELLSAGLIVPFPLKDVKPGDTWQSEIKEVVPLSDRLRGDAPPQMTTLKVKSKLMAVVPYKGRKCAQITTTYEMPFESRTTASTVRAKKFSGNIIGTINWYYDYTRSRTVSSQGSMQMTMKTSGVESDGVDGVSSADTDLVVTSTSKSSCKTELIR